MDHRIAHVCPRRSDTETGKECREAPVATRHIEQRAALQLTALQQRCYQTLLTPIDQPLVDGTIALPLVVLHIYPGHAVTSSLKGVTPATPAQTPLPQHRSRR